MQDSNKQGTVESTEALGLEHIIIISEKLQFLSLPPAGPCRGRHATYCLPGFACCQMRKHFFSPSGTLPLFILPSGVLQHNRVIGKIACALG